MEVLSCANWKRADAGESCRNRGIKACSACHLVRYCSKECQSAHWQTHKSDCKSPLGKPTWRPAWEVERRPPDFMESPSNPPEVGVTSLTQHGGSKYFWGNVPALDLLQLKDNEGTETSRDLSLLLAASGDLRNLVKTISCLPPDYSGSLHVDINDRDETVVVRNLMLLLIAFNFPPSEASTIMLHLWYSAFLPAKMIESLRQKVLPIIQTFVHSISSKSLNSLQRSTWLYGHCRLGAELTKETWQSLLSYFSSAQSISSDDARALRTSVTLAPERQDYRDRALFRLPPSWRLAQIKFRKDGVLLPFGTRHDDFNTPNPTLFQDRHSWPMPDSADPLDGWGLSEITQTADCPKNDLYGHLYFLTRNRLLKFCQRLSTMKLNIYLFHTDALALPERLGVLREAEPLYDRIELANISDRGYLGPHVTLGLFGPLLRPKNENPHATLVTLFLNAVHEVMTAADQAASLAQSMKAAMHFLPVKPEFLMSRDHQNADLLSLINAQNFFVDLDTLFSRFLAETSLEEIGFYFGLRMKARNAIVPKWPMRIRKNATQHEFEMLYWSGHQGSERYVEWYRI